nr:hypothetical protein [Lachnospiraceae bacterium]
MSTKGVYVKENPHIICFIVSVVFLLASLLNLHSADLSAEYIPLTGEITNVEEDAKLVRGTKRICYDFVVSWETDGQTYEKNFDDQVDYRPEGPVDIWVSPDGQQLRFSSSEEIYKEVPLTIAVGVIAGILGIILWKRKNGKRKYISKAERMDQLENRKIYSVIACLVFAVMAGFFGYEVYKEYNSLYVDVIISCVIGMFVCVGIFVHAHVKMK